MIKILFLGDVSYLDERSISRLSDSYSRLVIRLSTEDEFENKLKDETQVGIEINIRNFHELTIQIMDFEPDLIVYFSPILTAKQTIKDVELLDIVYIEIIEHLMEVMQVSNSKLYFISTDQVFSQINSNEKSPLDPITDIGQLLVMSEQLVVRNLHNTVIRIGNEKPLETLFSWYSHDKLLDLILDIYRKNFAGIIHYTPK